MCGSRVLPTGGRQARIPDRRREFDRRSVDAIRGGAVYLYDMASATPHTPVLALHHPSPADECGFGAAVAMSGSYLVVGAPTDDAPRVQEGASLSELIQLAIDSDAPIVVRDNDIDIGVITRPDILQTVIEGAETS